MKIDVDKLAQYAQQPFSRLDIESAPLDCEDAAFYHLIALARVGAAAVECNDRRMHGTEAEWRAAQAKRNSMTLDYLTTHPEGACP